MKKTLATTLILSLALGLGAGVANPYGIVAHVTRGEGKEPNLTRTLMSLKLAGIGYVRADIDSWAVYKRDARTFDFSYYDSVFKGLDQYGMQFLPIVYGPQGARPPEDEEYRAYLNGILKHYGHRFPVYEIWNEANLDGFFKGADPVRYAHTLKVAYETIKAFDPSIRVAYTGTAGVPIDWIRRTFAAGATNCFDVMNVHPYTHPSNPENGVLDQMEALRKLMAEFGVADRPVWFTEIGWPTHRLSFDCPSVFLAGLKVARPEQKTWNVLVVDKAVEGTPDQTVAEQILDVLPAGSRAVALNQPDSIKRLAEGGVDVVFFPLDMSFPADTIDAVNKFIEDGGVFVDMGGIPCYFGFRGSDAVEGMQHGGALGRFPFGYRAWWNPKNGTIPHEAQVFATPAGLAAGVKQEPTGFKVRHFVAPVRAGEHEWIPLVSTVLSNGVEVCGAGVIRYKGKRRGAAVLSALKTSRDWCSGTNDEMNQARFTARALGIAFAEGVEAYFTYNLRAREDDPDYSEDHFGLMHADFQPKPAYGAYMQFTRARPAGSVNRDGVWHDRGRGFYHPQWTRPDGTKAGMLWKTGDAVRREISFTGGTPKFQNMFGMKIAPRETAPGRYLLEVSGSPVYFSGVELAPLD